MIFEMNLPVMEKILVAQVKAGGSPEITVSGISMNPTLYEGDRVKVSAKSEYEPGDILVFFYKHGTMLVHRLLLVKQGTYYCKGDNAFRLEDISKDQIIGAVTEVNGVIPESWDTEKIALSYAVNREFVRCGYNSDMAKETDIYKKYIEKIAGKTVAHS